MTFDILAYFLLIFCLHNDSLSFISSIFLTPELIAYSSNSVIDL